MLKRTLRRAVWGSPSIYFGLLALIRTAGRRNLLPDGLATPEAYRREDLVGPSTDIVIEGFPRSGNSYAINAMEIAQKEPLSIAHHFHVPAQVVYACRRSIPTLVIIRSAVDAVVSLKIRTPSLSLREGLLDWISFHRCILPLKGRFLAARFEDVISDFGRVTEQLNLMFGSRFGVFEHSPENVAEAFRRIEEWNATKHGGRVDESQIARPSEARKELKERLLLELQEKKYQHLITRADSLYRKLIT